MLKKGICNVNIPTQEAINSALASLQMEGFEIIDDTEELLRRYVEKEATANELIEEIKSKYGKEK